VNAYGNLVEVSRGESVKDEILGGGDASVPNQTFELKKKPLTYLSASSAGNEWSLKSSLEIYVNGILWSEVRSFFGTGPEDQVYIVRHDEEGNSTIIFGDGENGARLPSGEGNIVANYRHGAGEAAPPDNSITQMIKPVTDITSISNYLPAYGGSDAESGENIRENAPASALLFSPQRAVSIADFQTVATEVPGVMSAAARWVWDDQRQRPVVKLWYMGDDQLLESVSDALLNAADPTTPIQVLVADPEPVSLTVEVIVNSRYVPADVESEITNRLLGEDGSLLPENLGIGRPIFRSEIAAMVHEVEGIIGIQAILWEQNEMTDFGKDPGDGHYFDFTDGVIISTIAEDSHA
jgi:predicted phage baseplate assembly protein